MTVPHAGLDQKGRVVTHVFTHADPSASGILCCSDMLVPVVLLPTAAALAPVAVTQLTQTLVSAF